jgi:hypothetical protein
VAALTGALFYSRGAVFSGRFLLPALVLVPVFAAAVYFPRAAGFPLVLLGGCAVVWIGLSFLRYPPVNSPLGYLYRDRDNLFSVRIQSSVSHQVPHGAPNEPARSFEAENTGSLRIIVQTVSFAEWFPVIGGEKRGRIGEIRQHDRAFFTASGFSKPRPGPGISLRNHDGAIYMENFPLGIEVAVGFDGAALVFAPSWPPRPADFGTAPGEPENAPP